MSEVTHGFSTAQGIGPSNPCVFQGSTVYISFKKPLTPNTSAHTPVVSRYSALSDKELKDQAFHCWLLCFHRYLLYLYWIEFASFSSLNKYRQWQGALLCYQIFAFTCHGIKFGQKPFLLREVNKARDALTAGQLCGQLQSSPLLTADPVWGAGPGLAEAQGWGFVRRQTRWAVNRGVWGQWWEGGRSDDSEN